MAPTIASFSTDSGTVGDRITNDNTLTLTGTAEANATVKVFDGATLLGSAVANGSGAWSYTTAALANGAHSLTATATDAAGNTGVASAALSVTIDTTAPVAPSITSFSPDTGTVGDGITTANVLTLTGSAEANATVKVYDGATLLGSAVANGSGAWTYATAALANGAHSLTATATDAAGNTGVASAALAVTVTAPPGVPTITSFSPDTGVVGDGITDPAILTLTGRAVANSTVNVYDSTTLLGTATANASGAWSFITVPLPDGVHSFTATDTVSGITSAASVAMSVTVDTVAPAAPVIASDMIVNGNAVMLTGTAEANSKVTVFDGGALLGTSTTDSSGAWSYTTGPLSGGPHSFTATATDTAGNTSLVSQIFDPIVGGTTIEANGATSLIQVGSHYYLDESAGAVPPSLKYLGADYAAGQFGAWTPIGAEKTATGYEIAWKSGSADLYTLWTTDNNGNYISNIVPAVSGSSIESFENSFHQDLNGDGQIGVGGVATVIESNGSTSLTEVGNHYYLDDSTGAGPSLKYVGADYVAGQFGAWTPIGAEKTATGYEIAWKSGSADLYTLWTTDNNGNYISNIVPAVSGSSIESFENSFHQDLNGDGQIGVGGVATVVESNGSTSLTEVGNHYYLDDSTGSGPSLKYVGADYVAGQFGAWTPIGAEKTATGYEVAWKSGSADLYTIWTADNNGNYISNIATGSGSSTALQSFESSFHQDLNGDGYIGLVLNGSSGGQTLTATGGTTTLIGGANDILNGGAGADTFVFPANFGSNTVNNFTPGTDALQFSQSMFATVAAVLSDAQQVGSNVVITHDPQNVVTLQNMQLANLHASDIHIL